MALPPVLRLCAVLLVVLLPAAAAQQEAVGECQQYTNRSCEECLKNVTCLWCASSRRPDKEDERAARERERRRVRQEERRAEMKSRHDEIRRKYGLFKEENPYAKFEN